MRLMRVMNYMTFRKLAEYFQELEATSSRLKMMEILARLFAEAEAKEVDKICYLSLGRLGPAYETVEFQIAEKMIMRAIAQAFGVKEAVVVREYKKQGDLGEVGEKLKTLPCRQAGKNQKPKTKNLAVTEVYNQLLEIAREAGEGSQERKIAKMAKLLNDLDSLSVKYVVRIPLGKLRLGFSDLTMIDGFSYMVAGDKSLSEKIREAYEVRADVGWVAKKIKNEKLKMKNGKEIIIRDLGRVEPEPGVPVVAALCQRVGTAEEMIKKVGRPHFAEASRGKVAVEPKFDGTRLQIHVIRDTGYGIRNTRYLILDT